MRVFNKLSNSLTGQSKSTKRVTFNDVDQIDQIEIIENKQDIWFSTREKLDISESINRMEYLSQCMNFYELEIKSGESPRGLEHVQRQAAEVIHQRYAKSVKSVVATQKLFPNMSQEGRACVSRAYGMVGQEATQAALERAEMDERFVMDHVRIVEPTNRIFERRCPRPAVLGRQPARRSVANAAALI